jgi:acetyltransferase-like isoleucine patch superfamily enzyme
MSGSRTAARIRTYVSQIARVARRLWLVKFWGMEIGEGTRISFSARLDKTNPRGIHLGNNTAITMDAIILTHDFVNRKHKDVYIGSYCFIGARSIFFQGVTIGDHSIVSAASVVMKDVPPKCVVAGNPARVVETNIRTGEHGHRLPKFEALTDEAPAKAAAGSETVAASHAPLRDA